MENGESFCVNIWDFGGQEIYHETHQFFLTKRSLYALVADNRKEDTDFYYWLNVVELLSDNSPLLIIKNEKQERHWEIQERQLRGRFTNLKETLATNLATNRGLPEILAEIKHYIGSLPHVGTPLPKTWAKVRETLEKDPRNYIGLDEYLDICERCGFTERKRKLGLSEYLHDLGDCLHFQEDPLLKNVVILKPQWGTDAVYRVLDNKAVIRNMGRFSRGGLEEIWHKEKYANMQDALLQLMINFKLCYQLPDRGDYIAPQLLALSQPEYYWDETQNLILRYTYDFMPKGILTRFIVATHQLIADQQFVWRVGVILESNDTQAEVIENHDKRELTIRIAGKHKKELMTIVTYELDKIHQVYNRLRYSKFIPCNCATCKDNQTPHFYAFDTLREFIANNQQDIQCQKPPFQMVDILTLIDDVIGRREISANDAVSAKRGDLIFQGPVESIVLQQSDSGDNTVQKPEEGDNIMAQHAKEKAEIKSSWANGSFYLFVFGVVIAGLGILANSVPWYALPTILMAALLFVPLIGALQFRQDDRLSEASFTELMKMVIGQLPLIGKRNKKDSSDE